MIDHWPYNRNKAKKTIYPKTIQPKSSVFSNTSSTEPPTRLSSPASSRQTKAALIIAELTMNKINVIRDASAIYSRGEELPLQRRRRRGQVKGYNYARVRVILWDLPSIGQYIRLLIYGIWLQRSYFIAIIGI